VQYGPVMCAVIIYLFMGQFLSKKRTAQAIGELFAIPVSDGTVAAVTARAAGDLGEFLTQVTARLVAAPAVNLNETGLRCQGRNAWLHSASTPTWSLLFAHHRRGDEAMNAMGVLPGFTGTAVHDAWAPYDTYTTAGHALCGAHLLRELQAVTDHHATTANPASWCWADQRGVTSSPDSGPTAPRSRYRFSLWLVSNHPASKGREHGARYVAVVRPGRLPGRELTVDPLGIRMLVLECTQVQGCPDCGTVTGRVHSRRPVQVRDLPFGRPWLVRWDKRRMFCDQTRCPRRTFVEPQHPTRAAPAAHRPVAQPAGVGGFRIATGRLGRGPRVRGVVVERQPRPGRRRRQGLRPGTGRGAAARGR